MLNHPYFPLGIFYTPLAAFASHPSASVGRSLSESREPLPLPMSGVLYFHYWGDKNKKTFPFMHLSFSVWRLTN
jgi:hypothetical protein